MPCYSPIEGYRGEGGKLTLAYRPHLPEMIVPCGTCIGCRLDRARDWAVRCVHEAQMHTENSYITLTYSPENLPPGGSLCLEHFQQFTKDMRNRGYRVRYFHCGEYGEQLHRPHYHAILFGIDFPDKKILRLNKHKQPLYRSAELDSLWPHGHSSIGDVTFQSAGYVARYITKKQTGDAAADHYWTKPDENGETHKLKPEYTTMSRRPGIGHSWYEKYRGDLFPNDQVILDTGKGTRQYPVPRYYDKLLEREDPDLFEEIKWKRTVKARDNYKEQSRERLEKKEQHKLLTIKKLTRDYEHGF